MNLHARNISFAWPDAPSVIQNLSLELDKGQLCILHGPNGSGKTTLLKILAGLLAPDGGAVTFNDQAVRQSMHRFAWLDTTHGTDPNLTPEKIIKFEKEFFNIKKIDSIFKQKKQKSTTPLRQLSSGEQKKVMLNLILHQEKDIYFFDEPEQSLDKNSVEEFYSNICKKIKKGNIIIIASHYNMREMVPENTLFFFPEKGEKHA